MIRKQLEYKLNKYIVNTTVTVLKKSYRHIKYTKVSSSPRGFLLFHELIFARFPLVSSMAGRNVAFFTIAQIIDDKECFGIECGHVLGSR